MAIIDDIRAAAGKHLLFLPHAIRQMARPDRMITVDEISNVVSTGEAIEDYPNDPRGHSCPLLGTGESGRAIHVLCSPKLDYLAIITAYLPDPLQWSADL